MTSATETSEQSQSDEADLDTLYAVDKQAYEAANEDYLFAVWQRLCWAGECRLCRRFPEGKPLVPMNSTEAGIYAAASTCPSKVQFITAGMSLLEAVFRILISDSNKPMAFGEIIEKLKEHWGTEYPQRIDSPVALQRVLDNPNEYHIGRATDA